jgi:hypothetical protein
MSMVRSTRTRFRHSFSIVQDARRLLDLAEQAKAAQAEQPEAIAAAAALLERLLAQDVEEKPEGGCQIKQGTDKDRLASVHDPEMRHGHKSASKFRPQSVSGGSIGLLSFRKNFSPRGAGISLKLRGR